MATVKVYSTPWCAYCKKAKEYFAAHNIAFTESDVSTDEKARDEMISKSGQLGVPVIDIDGKITVGFDQDRLAELLGIK
jgi:glutaredoxin 3